MKTDSRTLPISKCPHCGLSHEYSLIVYIVTYAGLTPGSNQKQFTRFLTCPRTNKDFEVTFALKEEGVGMIKSVEMGGIIDEP